MQAVRPRPTWHVQSGGPRTVRSDGWTRPLTPSPRRFTPTVPVAPRQPPRQPSGFRPYTGPPKDAHLRRLTLLAWLWGLLMIVIVVRIMDLQVFRRAQLAARASGQQERQIVLEARRGRIMDRNGTDLAVSLNAASVAVNPRKVESPGALARRISAITGEPVDRIYRRISQRSRAFA